MKQYHELTPEQILAAVEGFPDELGAAKKADDAFYTMHSTCKRCQHKMIKSYDVRVAFNDPNQLLPKAILTCQNCGFQYDPHNNLVLDCGNASKLQPDWVYVGSKEG